MKRNNRVVLMLSGGAMLSGVLSGAASLAWDAWSALQLRASALQSLDRTDLVPVFGSPVAEGASSLRDSPSLPRPKALTPEVLPDAQAPRFTLAPVDKLPDERSFYPVALNNRGEVLGGLITRDPNSRDMRTRLDAVIYRGGVLTVIKPLPGYRYCWPMALNNRGQAVCIAYGAVQPRLAASALSSPRVALKQGAFAPLPLPETNPQPATPAPGGAVISTDENPSPSNRILLWENGASRDLHIAEQLARRGVGGDVLNSMYRTRIGINDRTQITLHLESLYWWANGKLHLAGGRMSSNAPLLPLNNQNVLVRPSVRALAASYDRTTTPAVEWYDVSGQRETSLAASEVWDMNDKSEVLCSQFFTGRNPVRQYKIVDRMGKSRLIASVPYFGVSFLNDKGQVVGLSSRAAPNVQQSPRFSPPLIQHGPFWCGTNRLYDLNALIPAHSGWTIQQVRDFNDHGEILALAYNATAQSQVVLLRPVAAHAFTRPSPARAKPPMVRR